MHTKEDIYRKITPIFRDLFEDETLNPTEEMSASDVPAWDSLTHIGLIVAIENEFKTRFTISELGDLKNVGQLITLISQKTSHSE